MTSIAACLPLVLACGVAACTGGADGGDPDAAPPAIDAHVADWSAVDALVRARLAANGDTPAALVIFDRDDRVLFARGYGGFTTGQRVAVASASKLVAGLVLFDVIRTGELSLDSTTGAVLGWTGPEATITLRHLLSFTSGLAPDAACTARPAITLAACVDEIAAAAPLAAPGARFDYGSTHLQVAARMAEVATGMSWNALYRARVADRLGLPADVTFFTLPRQSLGQVNPLVAGGLRASMDEYAAFLQLAFHRGVRGAVTVGTPAVFDAQASEPYPAAVIGESPVVQLGYDYHYGLSSWLLCAPPASACPVIASPGAFGFTPWFDRDAGYSAILGMDVAGTGSGVVGFAVALQQDLAPLIRAQL